MTPMIDLFASNFFDMFVYIVACIFFIVLAGTPLLIVSIITRRIRYIEQFKFAKFWAKEEQDALGEEYRAFETKWDVVYKDLK